MVNSKLYHHIRRIQGTPRKNAQGPVQNKLIVSNQQFDCPNWALDSFLNAIGRTQADYDEFTTNLIGTAITPFDSGYDAARTDADPAFNKYPYFIVYCNGIADVQKTIAFAAKSDTRPAIPILPRGGGHSTEGYSVTQQGITIDVSRMQGVIINSTPDNNFGVPYAVIEGGVTWAKAYQEAQAYNFHVVGGDCDSVGVAGFTQGGGYSKTSIKYGMGSDNILRIKMVDVYGNIVVADKDTNPSLYWAVRGGTGGQFGIVVEFNLQLFPILPKVYKIEVNWPIDVAAQVLYAWQQNLTQTINPAYTDLGILGFLYFSANGDREDAVSRTSTPFFTIRGVWLSDDTATGQQALSSLLAIPGWFTPDGLPIFDPAHLQPYPVISSHLLDDVEGVIPDAALEIKRCAYVEQQLQVADYQVMVNYFLTSPSEYNIVSMEPYGGGIAKYAPSDTAFVHRSAYFDIFVDSFWMTDDQRDLAVSWLDGYFEGTTTSYLWSNHYYQNYVYSNYKNWQQGYFDFNYTALQNVKWLWDPAMVLSYEQSITPAAPSVQKKNQKKILVPYANHNYVPKKTVVLKGKAPVTTPKPAVTPSVPLPVPPPKKGDLQKPKKKASSSSSSSDDESQKKKRARVEPERNQPRRGVKN